jgi:hypothetical protein
MNYSALYRCGKNNFQFDFSNVTKFKDWFENCPDIPWAVLVNVKTGAVELCVSKPIR